QGLADPAPGAVFAPAAVPGMDSAPGREVLGEQPPLAAGAHQGEDGVENLAHVRGRTAHGVSPREKRLQQSELFVREIGFIALGVHALFYARTDFSHRLLGINGTTQVDLEDVQSPMPVPFRQYRDSTAVSLK